MTANARKVTALMTELSEAGKALRSDDPSDIWKITRPGVAAVIWDRMPLTEFVQWIEKIPRQNLPVLNAIVALEAVESCIHAACDYAGTPHHAMRNIFASDVAALAFIVSEITGARLLSLRIFSADDRTLPLSDESDLIARMACNYRGRGLQLINRCVQAPPETLKVGSAALIRGPRWPVRKTTSLLQRTTTFGNDVPTPLSVIIDALVEGETIH